MTDKQFSVVHAWLKLIAKGVGFILIAMSQGGKASATTCYNSYSDELDKLT